MEEDTERGILFLFEHDDIANFIERLMLNAKQSLICCTQALAPEFLNNAHLCRILSTFLRKNHRNQARFLTCNSQEVESRGHHVVALAQKLPSYVKIRKIPFDLQEAYASFVAKTTLIVDDRHGVVIPQQVSHESATALWDQKGKLSAMVREFDLLWERSEEITGFRRLDL